MICEADAALHASDHSYGGIGVERQITKDFADREHLQLTIRSLLSRDDARRHHPGDDPASRDAHAAAIVALVVEDYASSG